jgi:hypothetical protein
MDTFISKYLYINYVLNINFTLILVLPTCSQWFTVLVGLCYCQFDLN